MLWFWAKCNCCPGNVPHTALIVYYWLWIIDQNRSLTLPSSVFTLMLYDYRPTGLTSRFLAPNTRVVCLMSNEWWAHHVSPSSESAGYGGNNNDEGGRNNIQRGIQRDSVHNNCSSPGHQRRRVGAKDDKSYVIICARVWKLFYPQSIDAVHTKVKTYLFRLMQKRGV